MYSFSCIQYMNKKITKTIPLFFWSVNYTFISESANYAYPVEI